MYAIAIYDNFENKLYLHKDLYGKKPLYYLIYKNTFFFSSEISQTFIKNIKKISNEELDVNFFMNFGFCKNHINKKIFSVNNSEFIEFSFKNNEIKKKNKYFFDFDFAEGFNTSNNFNHFENILEKSVSRRLISDRPLGLFLSSGFDSNIIAHYASKLSKKKIKAYTLGFQNSKNYNELKFQKELANSLNFDFESVHVDEDIITNEINSVVELDLPIADPSFFLEKYLCNYAKQEIDVVLTGDGGDEIFGGYNRYKFLNIYKRLFSKLNKTIIFKFADLLKKFKKNNFLKNNIFKKILSSQSYEDKFEKIIAILKSSSLHESYFNLLRYDIKNNNINSFNSDFDYSFFEKFHGEKNFQIYDLIFYMQHNILFKIDRASMLNGLEIRSPFLDEEILKNFFYSGLNKPNKYLLKKLSKKLGIKKYINKNKMGFSFDIQDYLLKKSEDLIFELNNINNCFNNDQKKNIIDNYNKYKNGNKYNFWFIWKFYILNKYLNAK